MRLVFTIKSLSIGGGGAERVLSQIASKLADRGHVVYIITFDRDFINPFYPISKEVILKNISLSNYSIPSLFLFFIKIYTLRNEIKKINPDIVIGFMHSTFLLAALAMIGTGKRVIASEHIIFKHYMKRPLELLLYILLIPFLYKIIVVSEEAKNTYPYIFRLKMCWIKNPITGVHLNERIDDDNAKLKLILSIGRFDNQKDHITLIRAFSIVSTMFPEWRLRIIGDGPLFNECKDECSRLNLTEKIEMPGLIRDISKEYINCSFFVLASRYESFGLVFAEALLFCRAVIAMDYCVGITNIVKNGQTAILANGAQGAQGLSDAMKFLITNPEVAQKIGYNGREAVLNYTSCEEIVYEWERLLYKYSS